MRSYWQVASHSRKWTLLRKSTSSFYPNLPILEITMNRANQIHFIIIPLKSTVLISSQSPMAKTNRTNFKKSSNNNPQAVRPFLTQVLPD